jgi:NADPH:quinone reductase-like Zn-dependent oxidoreductase
MRAVILREYGGPEVLTLEDVEKPAPASDEVLIQVHATSVNAIEWKIRGGMGEAFGIKLPFVPGSEIAGVVEAAGEGIHHVKPGDAVFGFVDLMRSGGYAEYITAKESEIALKPANLDFPHAAALPVGALTSWQAMFDTAHLQSGQKILIHGASGGVGSLAVQLAKAKGAYVIATGSGRSAEFVKSLGADEFIDYSTTKFEEAVTDADVVFDTIGGETQNRSFQALKRGGFLVSIIAPPSEELAAKFGVQAAVLYAHPNGETLAEIAKLVEAGEVTPHLETVLPLAEIQQAHELMEHGSKRGKIVLQIARGHLAV